MYRCSYIFEEKHTYKHSFTRVAHVFDDVIAAQSVSSGSFVFFLFETNDEAACGASVAASVANFEMIRPANFDDWGALRKTGMFQELFAQVQLAVAPGMERECLSHHTTASCRARRAPLVSLMSCGMNTAIRSPDGPGTYVHVHLPHSFYDDDSWRFDYYSRPRFG